MSWCKYRMRWFSSKGAFLVMLWTILTFVTFSSLLRILKESVQIYSPLKGVTFFSAFLLILLSGPLSEWLADAKFGNYKVFRAGAVLLFVATVLNCLFLILKEMVWESNLVVTSIHMCLVGSLALIGICACSATVLPLGLDQMPDASSSNISSYIAWFVCSILIAYYTCQVLEIYHLRELHLTLVWALCLTVCMTVILTSIFLFNPRWLIIEPKAPQSLRKIYQVLKFAAKHKAPLNRSAFTYWEDDIPSRIDLGKSKYGGPFTMEQVEDVKTVLRLIAIYLSFSFIIFASFHNFIGYSDIRYIFIFYTKDIARLFLSKMSFFSIFGILVHEFVIYPLFGHRFPSILKRIGAVSLVITLTSLVCFILKLVHYLSHSDEAVTQWIVYILLNIIGGLLIQALLTLMIEFLAAQAPYNMRGMLNAFGILLILWSAVCALSIEATKFCKHSWCPLIPFLVKAILCVIGFLLFCVVARWYKRRVRDEDYSTQAVVEEVYDRYLTAAAAQTRSYGINN